MRLFTTILCPIDLETHSLSALETARKLAEQSEARVCLVHAVTPPLPGPLEPAPELEKRVRSRLEQIAAKYFGSKVRCDIGIRRGEAGAAILRAVKDVEADLIVMATHGHKGLNRMLLGSVAERVVRESPVPVLTIRPGQATQRRLG
jgi:nucleotide-binding universal stress UspA family protein